MYQPTYDELEEALTEANDALFDCAHMVDEEYINHIINEHSLEDMIKVLESVTKANRLAMEALQKPIQKMVGG